MHYANARRDQKLTNKGKLAARMTAAAGKRNNQTELFVGNNALEDGNGNGGNENENEYGLLK